MNLLKQLNDKLGFTVKDVMYIMLIGIGLFFGYRLYKDLTAQMESQKIAYKQLAENIARGSTEYVTKKDLDNFGKTISSNFEVMKKDIKKLGGEVTAVGHTVATLKENVERDKPSDHHAEIPTEDGTGSTAQDFKKIKTEDGLPLSWAMYKVGYENPWTVGTYPLEFHINTVLGVNKDDQIIPENELIVYNNQDAESKGKPFKLKIESSEFKQTRPSKYTFFKWAPHLDFGVNAGASLTGKAIFGPDLGFSIMAYGRTKNDNLWRFARVGFGFRDRFSGPQFTASPIGYNLGAVVPIITDLWVYPTVSFGFADTYGIGASITTTF